MQNDIAPCGIESIVEQVHLVSWPSIIRGYYIRVVLFTFILLCATLFAFLGVFF